MASGVFSMGSPLLTYLPPLVTRIHIYRLNFMAIHSDSIGSLELIRNALKATNDAPCSLSQEEEKEVQACGCSQHRLGHQQQRDRVREDQVT